jgi:hypothetical protein
LRHIRKVTRVRGRVSKWTPVGIEGVKSGIEPDGNTYFWSDDPVFEEMSRPGGGLLDVHGNRQWELAGGKTTHKVDPLTSAQKAAEQERRFRVDYPQDRLNQIIADAEEARMDGAAADDAAFVALKTMQNRKRAIAEEVDKL